MDAWLGGAAEQLMGQIASAKIPLSRMISPQLYWVKMCIRDSHRGGFVNTCQTVSLRKYGGGCGNHECRRDDEMCIRDRSHTDMAKAIGPSIASTTRKNVRMVSITCLLYTSTFGSACFWESFRYPKVDMDRHCRRAWQAEDVYKRQPVIRICNSYI